MAPSSSRQFLAPPLSETFAELTMHHVVGIILGGLVTFTVGLAVYRLIFHPLAKVPGPKLYGITGIPYLWRSHITGTLTVASTELHKKYGPIVRIAPDNVAIAGPEAWNEVFVYRKGKKEYTKIKRFNGPDGELQIIGALATEDHRRQRRHLAHAFSEAAMYEQESLITHYVEMLVDGLTIRAKKGEAVNMEKWYNFTTFDVIGDLSFGDSFHCLEKADYHPWVEMLFSSVRGGAAARFFRSAPLLKPFVKLLKPQLVKDVTANGNLRSFAKEKAKGRLAQGESPGGRRDFMTYMMRKNRAGENAITEGELYANVRLLLIAGSETTATCLSAFTFYMGRNTAAYGKVAAEVRGHFRSEADIDFRSVAKLPYLNACIEETLRILPPAAETPPRRSPGDFISGYWIPEGTTVTLFQWAVYREAAYFQKPDSFIPERWLPASHPDHDKKYDSDNKAVFHPFSHGPRNCIGKNLAYAELRMVLARFLYRFDYELLPGQDDWHSSQRTFIVWEKPPLMVKLTLRDQTV